jgi:two-component system, LytTR family, sensor kinase
MIAVSYQDNADDHGIEWWEPALWECSSALMATIWLLIQRRAATKWDHLLDQPLRWFGKSLAWLPVVAVTFVAGIYSIRHAVYALVGVEYEHERWTALLVYESVKLVLFAALWLCIIFGLESFARWRLERERLLVLQKTLAQSQLAQLRAQLQPHFLFNALNTISALMQSDVERADRLLARLADLLRASLAASSRQLTSLREEIQLLELYASIMQERFAGRVALSWEIAPDTLDAAIPAMLLQPLLENAYKHGVERSSTPVQIQIKAQRQGENLLVTVRNTGAIHTGRTPGIGLVNSRERLALLHGERASLTLDADGDAVIARLTLPWQRHAE